jgi:hypothetical protein
LRTAKLSELCFIPKDDQDFIFCRQIAGMTDGLWTIPLISTLCGLIAALLTRAVIFRRIPKMMNGFISSAKEDISSINTSAFENIRPTIEAHIDNFLRHKLSKALPMLSMFIGEKTINQLKSVFMKELEEIFPNVIGKYSDDLFSSAEVKLTPVIISKLKKELRLLPIAGLTVGLLTGVIQLLALAVVK